MPRKAASGLSDAGFAAGIALKTLDDLVRSEPAGRAAGARARH
ncbi:hypothetical protein [Nitratireductor sp. L15S-10]